MVDAVNNSNNNAVLYSGIGATAGLAAGAGYGAWLSKPLLDGDAPSDAFVKRAYDNIAKKKVEDVSADVTKNLEAITGYKDAKNIDELKKALKDDAEAFKPVNEDITKAQAVIDFIGEEKDLNTLKAKYETHIADNAKKGITDLQAYKEADSVDKLKKLLNENADKFGFKAEVGADGKETKALEQVINDFIGGEADVNKIKGNLEAKVSSDAVNALKGNDAYKAVNSIDTMKTYMTNAEDAGLPTQRTVSVDEQLKKIIGDETDVAKAKEKVSKHFTDAATENINSTYKDSSKLQALKKDLEGLADNADEAARKSFIQKNAEALGIKDADIDKVAANSVESLKESAKKVLEPLENAKATVLDHFDPKEGMKKLADNADDATKSIYEIVKKAARDTKLWAGAKWAGIGALVLGIGGYIASKFMPSNKA